MVPTTILVFLFAIIQSCINLQKKFEKFRLNIGLSVLAIGDMILKQPIVIISPHIMPFFFTLTDIKIYDMVPVNVENGKHMKSLSCIGTYSYSPTLTKMSVIIRWRNPSFFVDYYHVVNNVKSKIYEPKRNSCQKL